MSETNEWRWADVGGRQNVVRFDELTDALASGTLPAYVLVWRSGWTEWHSASNVPELAAAVGNDRLGPPDVIRSSPGSSEPPPPPVARYASQLVPGARTLLQPRRTDRPSTVPPPVPRNRPAPPRPPTPSFPHKPAPPLKPGVPPPPGFIAAPIQIRDVMPTLAGEEPTRSPTLRPAGALPPPPRAIPIPKTPVFEEFETEIDVDEDDDDEVPAPPPVVETPTVPLFPSARVEQPALPAPTPAIPSPVPEAPAAPTPYPTQGESVHYAPSHKPTQRAASAPSATGGLSRDLIARVTSVVVLMPGIIALALVLNRPPRSKHDDDAPPSPSATAESAVPKSGPLQPVAAPIESAAPAKAVARVVGPAGCTVSKTARRLAEAAFVGVPPIVARAPDGHLAIGFAGSKDTARGVTLDPETQATTSAFDAPAAEGAVLGVVPLVRAGKLSFAVDRAGGKLSFARTVDAAAPFSIGVTGEGFSRAVGDAVSVIWPGKSDNPTITTPRVETVPGKGHAVVLRHGGQEGKVLAGWLHEDGTALAGLKAVATDSTLVGTPTIGASDQGVLVAFAGKLTASDGWRVELASAAHGALPERATVFALPEGGPGGEAISPSAGGLRGGRFVLQWTEGSAGNRAVRAQVLSANLAPQGEPLTLSTPEQNAGQGALFVDGERTVLLFLVKKETSHELWEATLTCR